MAPMLTKVSLLTICEMHHCKESLQSLSSIDSQLVCYMAKDKTLLGSAAGSSKGSFFSTIIPT
eukprot:877194-Ditylum_brightwellii.AAC.1